MNINIRITSFNLGCIFTFLILFASESVLQSQCLTTFDKLLPEEQITPNQGYGYTISRHKNYLAVGAYASDSLALDAGLVHIYEDSGGSYSKVATIASNQNRESFRFGISIYLSENYLIVLAQNQRLYYQEDVKPVLHIYKKPASGWENTNNAFVIRGLDLVGHSVDIKMSEDESKIYMTGVAKDYGGALILVKNGSEWDDSFNKVEIDTPEEFREGNAHVYDGKQLALHGNYMMISDRFGWYNNSNAVTYVFKDHVGDGISYTPVAPLVGDEFGWTYGLLNVVVDDNYTYHSAFGSEGSLLHVFPKSTEYQEGNDYYEIPYSLDTIPVIARSIKQDEDFLYVTGENQDSTLGFYTFDKSQMLNPGYIPEKLNIGKFSFNYGNITQSEVKGDSLFIATTNEEKFGRDRGSVKIYDKSGSTIQPIDTLFEEFTSATEKYYGSSVYQFNGFLLVSNFGDATLNVQTGAVDVLKNNGTAWVYDQKILPTGNINSFDDLFGYSLDHYEQDLVIGAPGFGAGKVFIYENENASGLNLNLKQTLNPPDTLGRVEFFGSEVAIGENILAVSAHDKNETVKYSLLIYERSSPNAPWVLSNYKVLTSVNIFDKSSALSIEISERDEIVVGGEILSEGVDIYEKNAENNYEIKATLSQPNGSQFDRFGSEIKITKNHIFISAFGKDYESKSNVGAIYVYAKPATGDWSSTDNAVEILPYDLIENGLFGYSFEVEKNTLLVGASGVNEYFDGTTFLPYDEPGAAYVIQGVTYDWTETVDYLKLQGESLAEADKFGYGLSLSKDFFFVGAVNEDTEKGFNSGAVYAIKTPPLIQQVPPVCIDNEVINLFEYPYGGVWEGPGIIDPEDGIFDPEIAGLGTHLITYETENCAYLGKLRIEVLPSLDLNVESDLEQLLCSENIPELMVSFESTVNFEWYYSESGETFNLVSSGVGDSSIHRAQNPGFYYCQIDNSVCTKESPLFTINSGDLELRIEPVPAAICDDESLILEATPPGGTWFGVDGISSDGQWNHKGLPNGIYNINYYKGKDGICYDTTSIQITKANIKNAIIEKHNSNLCSTGSSQISFEENNTITNWEWHQLDGQPTIINGNVNPLNISVNGSYKAIYSNEFCSSESNVLLVDDKIEFDFLPDQNEYNICENSENNPQISIQTDPSDVIAWFKYDSIDNHSFVEINRGNALQVQGTGWYKAYIQQNNCDTLTTSKYVDYYPADSVFVPNVVTANNDGYNDTFAPYLGTYKSAQFIIYNRYGKIVYDQLAENSSMLEWSPKVSSGVYFWYIKVNGPCNAQNLKGSVQVLK